MECSSCGSKTTTSRRGTPIWYGNPSKCWSCNSKEINASKKTDPVWKEKFMRTAYPKSHTPEARRKGSESKKGSKNPMFGLYGNDNPRYGRPMSKTSREKRRNTIRRKILGKNVLLNWKGCGVVRTLWRYQDWVHEIFRRDDHKCIVCGSTHRLNAHHIVKSMIMLLLSNYIKTVQDALACDELWDTMNGITLCITCHKKTYDFGRTYLT